jgi:hypothetical protein
MANLRFEKLDLLPRPAAPHFKQSIDYGIQIHFALVGHGWLPRIRSESKKGRRETKKKGAVEERREEDEGG